MEMLITKWRFIQRLTKQVGPYFLLELLLPGGTLLTILLLMYRSGALTALQSMPVTRQHISQIQAPYTALWTDPALCDRS